MYSLVDWTNGVRVKRASEIPEGPVHPAQKWVPEVKVTPEGYDESLHVLKRQSQGLVGDEWRILYSMRDKTLPEKQHGIRSDYQSIYAAGFTYGGKQFPFDVAKYTATYAARTALNYPRRVTALDGTILSLANADEVVAFWATGVAAYEAIADAEQDDLEAVNGS